MRLFGSAPASTKSFALGGLEEVMAGAEICSNRRQPGLIKILVNFRRQPGGFSAKPGLMHLSTSTCNRLLLGGLTA